MTRKWTSKETQFLRRHSAELSRAEIARRLRRSLLSVKNRAHKLGLRGRGRAWAASDRRFFLRNWKRMSWGEIVRRLKKPYHQITSFAYRQGISKGLPKPTLGEPFKKFLLEKHAAGWSDAEISAAWGCERHTVGDWRRRLRLASNALSEHRRQRVREKTAEQLKRAGLPTLAAVRAKAYRDRARAAGWPEDLRPQSVQILNALWDRGPMTRRQIADAIGVAWKGSRASLHSNDPEGSSLAHLIRRGMVITLGRVVKGKGPGRNTYLYSLPISIERKAAS